MHGRVGAQACRAARQERLNLQAPAWCRDAKGHHAVALAALSRRAAESANRHCQEGAEGGAPSQNRASSRDGDVPPTPA